VSGERPSGHKLVRAVLRHPHELSLLHAAARTHRAADDVGEEGAVGGGDAVTKKGALDLDEAYRLHAGAVARWVARLAGPGYDHEDMVHDVFVVAQRRWHEWRGDALVSTWLYEIAFRVVQDRRRTRRRWRFFPWLRREADRGWPSSLCPQPPQMTPVDLVERQADISLLYELLDELPEKQRTALLLFEVEGLPGEEIARLLRTSVPNIWTRVARARAAVLRALDERRGGRT
jgi:RNA polymerase sigma-70 factor (ECF subfamily)